MLAPLFTRSRAFFKKNAAAWMILIKWGPWSRKRWSYWRKKLKEFQWMAAHLASGGLVVITGPADDDFEVWNNYRIEGPIQAKTLIQVDGDIVTTMSAEALNEPEVRRKHFEQVLQALDPMRDLEAFLEHLSTLAKSIGFVVFFYSLAFKFIACGKSSESFWDSLSPFDVIGVGIVAVCCFIVFFRRRICVFFIERRLQYLLKKSMEGSLEYYKEMLFNKRKPE